MVRAVFISLVAGAALAGCEAVPADPDASAPKSETAQALLAPPGAPPGTCWGKTVTPAVIETVTADVLLQPAEISSNGNVLSPPIYKTETRQQIVAPRRDNWFETPCPNAMTPEFVASLQRALQARGLYRGAISGEMDARTQSAVRKFQTANGLKSETLSLDTARALGLVAIPRPPSD